jgi:hypothetical protein
MKQPNTLPELLRHAADLAEKGCDDFDGKFESKHFTFGNNNPAWKVWTYVGLPNFNDGNEWRIADQDQHLLDDGWIRHTGDVCPVHKRTMVTVRVGGSYRHTIAGNYFTWFNVTHYKIIKEYIEPTTFEMKVGDKVFMLNKPYMSAPENGVEYWAVSMYGYLVKLEWDGGSFDRLLLNRHSCWRTEADAKAYAEAKLARDNFEIGEIK